MANEIRGILYETIAQVALERAIKLAKLSGILYWNEKPEGVSVVPDFTIGVDPNKPTHVILVTASGAARNSEIKAWRNLGEMQEIKAQLPGPPIVINLYFMSEVKKGVSEAANTLYDVVLHVPEKTYYAPLENWTKKHLQSRAKTQADKTALLVEDIASDNTLDKAVESLAKDLATALKQRKTDLKPLWDLMRNDYQKPHQPPPARHTTVKRGLAKLLVLEPDLRQKVYASYKHGTPIPKPLPDYGFELGFFTKSIAGARLTDDEMLNVLRLLGADKCESLISKTPREMSFWINPLRDLDRVDIHVDYIEKHYDQVTDEGKLKKLLIRCFNDPSEMSGVQSDEKVWLLEIMISLIKAKSGFLQGYGLMQLAFDTGIDESGKGAPLLRIIMPKFVQREELPKDDILSAIASGVSEKFKNTVQKDDFKNLREKVREWVIKENLEDRLIPYRNFEPILWMLEEELTAQGKIYASKSPLAGWINDYAGVGHKVATTPFVRVGNTLIHWKTASDAGKVHKKKELSARVRSTRYTYNVSSQTFSRRPDGDRFVLIVDGTFDNDDLRVLSESGWDEIIYPDEIPAFVKRL